MMRSAIVVALVALAACDGLIRAREPQPVRATLAVAEALGGRDTAGYARVTGPREFRFPDDHGPHPEYRTEWWYFTGNVVARDGRRFGYQLTLFRNAIAPSPPPIDSDWATNQVFMAHLAVTDARGRTFHGFERFARAAAGLAGARVRPLHVWLEDWRIEQIEPTDHASIFPLRLAAGEAGIGIDLVITATKPLVLQGERGYNRKGAQPGNASHYYSFTRLATRGSIILHGDTLPVRGESWLDREWSTFALADGQVGWDWFALQLGDTTELMYYQIRRTDGSADRWSRGSFIAADGVPRSLARDDVRLDVLDEWTSPRGGRYPSRWRLRVPALALDVEIVPVLADQEHDAYVRYWEGAVDVRGTRAGRAVAGRGYVELTGYAE
jgi:predicted secreted hydrolase